MVEAAYVRRKEKSEENAESGVSQAKWGTEVRTGKPQGTNSGKEGIGHSEETGFHPENRKSHRRGLNQEGWDHRGLILATVSGKTNEDYEIGSQCVKSDIVVLGKPLGWNQQER